MKNFVPLMCAVLAIAIPACAQQHGAEKKPATAMVLKVKLAYQGAGTVDQEHKIFVFLFDSSDFQNSIPFAVKSASAKDETVTFSDVTQATTYVTTAYDPEGKYDGESGPPPTGSSLGMYSKTPGQAEPVKAEPGKTVTIELAFDDSFKMP